MRLVADRIRFGYHATPLLAGFSAEFRSGEMVAVTGPSGTGKSTLLYLLGLMVRPQGGTVLIDDSPVSCLPDVQRARLRAYRFGFVFQDALLDPARTVLDNVLEGGLYRDDDRSVAKLRAEQLLEQFGVRISPRAKPGQVSGGQAQRIALCRAMLHRPPIVLADEPTGNLDSDSALVVWNALREHAMQAGIVLVVTHDMELASRCDRQIRIP